MRTLIVEDEKKLADALAFLAKKQNIDLDIAYDGETGWMLAKKGIYDVIILDIMLPGIDGLEILRRIRVNKMSTPVLLLTARDSIEDRVKGLDLGADDYLVKPFATQELFARIRSLYRRRSKVYAEDVLKVSNVELFPDSQIMKIGDDETKLPIKEAQLMEMFMRAPKRTFSREYILDKIWGYGSDVGENNIEIYIHYLRKKLENRTSVKIVTVRGIGYTLKEK
ncbi:response regulator transcription factor [Wukongibacter baidiensis]|uniref:response regulator transcription factor n=1 Tax=Wukongibacter baidiensis TaxID=1723361 RepID=UPI003D7F605F